jgi:hypothetical protein
MKDVYFSKLNQSKWTFQQFYKHLEE